MEGRVVAGGGGAAGEGGRGRRVLGVALLQYSQVWPTRVVEGREVAGGGGAVGVRGGGKAGGGGALRIKKVAIPGLLSS